MSNDREKFRVWNKQKSRYVNDKLFISQDGKIYAENKTGLYLCDQARFVIEKG